MNRFIRFLKKNWSNVLFVLVIIIMVVPQTRMTVQVFFQRLISFSPSELSIEEQVDIINYDWDLTSLEGENRSLKSSEGNVILLNLWATWCPPCVAEMPSMQALYSNYGDKVDFYFVSSEDSERLTKFLQMKEYKLPVYQETSPPSGVFKVRTIPTTFVISKRGTLVMKTTGAANWNSPDVHAVLDRLLTE